MRGRYTGIARPSYGIETGDGMMQVRSSAAAARESPPPDVLLVERIAALSDKTALAELDARHGMTLYAIAHSLLFDPAAPYPSVPRTVCGRPRRAPDLYSPCDTTSHLLHVIFHP